jgi:predicted transcriptional regulator of viral defense system
MSINPFFAQHPVFRYEELRDYLNQDSEYKETSLKALLQYHLHKEHISRIRRGYYAVNAADALLIAGRVSEDAIITHHSALVFHGIAYSLLSVTFFMTKATMQAFTFEQMLYQRVSPPKVLLPSHIFDETKIVDRQGLDIRITTIERTLVDCLDKPQFSGGFEEIWRAAGMLDFLDLERMADYAITLDNATTIAKLGLFLEQYQEQFKVEEKILSILEKNKPKGIHHMLRGSAENYYSKRWNLMVPNSIKNKIWNEHDL